MPTVGKCWWHVILSTYGSWLPGNPRGSAVWARLGDFNRVETHDYWENCHLYILGQADSWIMWIEKGELRVKVT